MRIIKYIIIFNSLAFSQLTTKGEIVGLWHKGEVVGSGWNETYQFYANGIFSFYFSQYDETKRVVSLHGKYRFSGDTLFTKIERRTELIKGFVRRGYIAYEHQWVLDSTLTKSINQLNSIEEYAILQFVVGPKTSFIVDGIKSLQYYKISSNPNDYK